MRFNEVLPNYNTIKPYMIHTSISIVNSMATKIIYIYIYVYGNQSRILFQSFVKKVAQKWDFFKGYPLLFRRVPALDAPMAKEVFYQWNLYIKSGMIDGD